MFTAFLSFFNSNLVPLGIATAILVALFGVVRFYFGRGERREEQKAGEMLAQVGTLIFVVTISSWSLFNAIAHERGVRITKNTLLGDIISQDGAVYLAAVSAQNQAAIDAQNALQQQTTTTTQQQSANGNANQGPSINVGGIKVPTSEWGQVFSGEAPTAIYDTQTNQGQNTLSNTPIPNNQNPNYQNRSQGPVAQPYGDPVVHQESYTQQKGYDSVSNNLLVPQKNGEGYGYTQVGAGDGARNPTQASSISQQTGVHPGYSANAGFFENALNISMYGGWGAWGTKSIGSFGGLGLAQLGVTALQALGVPFGPVSAPGLEMPGDWVMERTGGIPSYGVQVGTTRSDRINQEIIDSEDRGITPSGGVLGGVGSALSGIGNAIGSALGLNPSTSGYDTPIGGGSYGSGVSQGRGVGEDMSGGWGSGSSNTMDANGDHVGGGGRGSGVDDRTNEINDGLGQSAGIDPGRDVAPGPGMGGAERGGSGSTGGGGTGAAGGSATAGAVEKTDGVATTPSTPAEVTPGPVDTPSTPAEVTPGPVDTPSAPSGADGFGDAW